MTVMTTGKTQATTCFTLEICKNIEIVRGSGVDWRLIREDLQDEAITDFIEQLEYELTSLGEFSVQDATGQRVRSPHDWSRFDLYRWQCGPVATFDELSWECRSRISQIVLSAYLKTTKRYH